MRVNIFYILIQLSLSLFITVRLTVSGYLLVITRTRQAIHLPEFHYWFFLWLTPDQRIDLLNYFPRIPPPFNSIDFLSALPLPLSSATPISVIPPDIPVVLHGSALCVARICSTGCRAPFYSTELLLLRIDTDVFIFVCFRRWFLFLHTTSLAIPCQIPFYYY